MYKRQIEIYELIESASKIVDEFSSLQPNDMRKLIKMGSSAASVFSFKDKLTGKNKES